MEVVKKLDIFYASAIEVASKKSAEELEEYTASLDRLFADFKEKKREEMESRYRIEEEKLRREANRRVSEAATEQKRRLNARQQEKKEALFLQVEKLIQEFRQTPGYEAFLTAKIRMAEEFAREDEMILYLDPEDKEKKERLEKETGCALTISEFRFGGGIRAVIRSRNVLIDESFDTKLTQEREGYTF